MSSHRLGRYTLLDELAQGGMSRVYVAQKDGADGICVLKQLLVELKTHEFATKRFYREAHIASFLDHPHIARLLDAGFEDDSFCIAMEYIAGSDVENLMRALGRTMPWELAVAIAIFVLDALSYAHDALDSADQALEVVHRDIAPRNVMVGFHGDVKLIDFGLARGKVGDFETEPGIIIGTLRYLSPEQARSEEIDRRSDIYSMGVVMHELLTGQKLVQEKTPLGVLKAIMNDSPPLMRTVNADLPAGIEIAVQKSLEKQKADRWQTAGDFRDAILDVVGNSFARAQIPKLGELVRKMFPEGERKAAVLRELGRHRFASVYGRSGFAGTLTEASPQAETIPAPGPHAPSLPAMATPWASLEEMKRLGAQLDQETRTEVAPPSLRKTPPQGIKKEEPHTDPGGTPPIPRPRSLRAPPGRGISDPALDAVDAPTVPIPLKKPSPLDAAVSAFTPRAIDPTTSDPTLADPSETDPTSPPLTRSTPARATAQLLDTADSEATLPSQTPSPPPLPVPPPPMLPYPVNPTGEVRRSPRAQALIADPADTSTLDKKVPMDDETAIANHPLVRRRRLRNQLVGVVVGLMVAAAVAILLLAVFRT